jgi:arylformamidase
MRWVDVTIPMKASMTVWPGDPAFSIEPAGRISDGAGCNTSVISMSTHTGTHCDAPWHFEPEGLKLHEVDTQVFFGDAQVIEVPDVEIIRAENLPKDPLLPRVLFKTKNSEHPYDAPFLKSYVALAPDAAQRCVDEGVKLVGIDYLSVAPFKQSGQPTHHILLQANVFVVEGLLLQGISPGVYPFVVLPMYVVDADGAPCRAFIGVEESRG